MTGKVSHTLEGDRTAAQLAAAGHTCRLLPRRTILYETDNLMLAGGTGIATYARTLAQAAGRLNYESHALFGVERGLARGDDRLNEVLAFDAIGEQPPSLLKHAWRAMNAPFAALGGLRLAELSRSGLVVGTMAESLRPFERSFVVTRLTEVSRAHFNIYGRLAQLRLATRPSLFHATHPVPVALKGCPNIYTIHDLVPLRLPYATLDNKKYLYRLLTKLARSADHIVTVSEYSRQDIIRHLRVDEKRVTNTYQALDIPAGVLTRSDDEVAEDLRRHFGLDLRSYFLFSGAIEPKKNISNLIDAYAASGTRLPLILAGGGGWLNRADLKKARDERFASFRINGGVVRRERQVRRLEYIPRDQLLTLIKGARALLFPSIYEGFGLPVIEAMALGTPVITSDVSSLPEIAGGAALLVDPHSVEEIARAISAIEIDDDLQAALIKLGRAQARKFSAETYDQRLSHLYNSL
jgi:glycosyltransferase involved in cell wall biosynthesis